MWRFDEPPTYRLADLAGFLRAADCRPAFLSPDRPALVARAPGRLDLMGGIADYSGSLVLELPLSMAAYVAGQPVEQPTVTVQTNAPPGFEGDPCVEYPLDVLAPLAGLPSYGQAHGLLTRQPEHRWAAYVLGAVPALQREAGAKFRSGLRLLVHSEVPLGKGVSSSAALEVAALSVLAEIAGLRLDGRQIALLCQLVENRVVGAPCGVMDQMTAACGQQDRLLALLCQPAELQDPVPLPPNVEVWGIDSGIRHAVAGADYTSVRVGAFMGYRIIAGLEGLPCRLLGNRRVAINDPRYRGYLANIRPDEWESRFREHLPERLSGAEFLRRYGGSTDSATTIDPARTYAVRMPTAHPIYEHDRVQRFRAGLEAWPTGAADLCRLGELMYESHESYGACGLGSDGTDRLVELVRAAGPERGLYGAKITGGGSGGTVAVLAERHSFSEIKRVASQYERETGRAAMILGGSSPGAVDFGVWRLTPN
jgi:L-arabinokinase